MNHVCIGVYASGNHVINIVKPEHLENHINYNKVLRFGRALFIDGKCVNKGYLTDEKITEWENKIKDMVFNISIPTIPYR